jgi:myo-inositol catabolism protein IolC
MRRAIAELQEAGIEPDIWKIEGLDLGARTARRSTEQTRSGLRPRGRGVRGPLGGAPTTTPSTTGLRTAAGVPGYVGFAIGRSIW